MWPGRGCSLLPVRWLPVLPYRKEREAAVFLVKFSSTKGRRRLGGLRRQPRGLSTGSPLPSPPLQGFHGLAAHLRTLNPPPQAQPSPRPVPTTASRACRSLPTFSRLPCPCSPDNNALARLQWLRGRSKLEEGRDM